jgi:TatD DNase family protein
MQDLRSKSALVDAHCHLQDERLASFLPEAMERAQRAGVTTMICCGSSEQDWEAVLALAARFPKIVAPALGLHPWYLRERSSEWLSRLESLLRAHPEAGVGECGLDHALEPRNDAEQEEIFVAQLDLARRLNRPVWVHARRAWGRLPELLEEHGPSSAGWVIHSYSGPPEIMESLSRLNVYFSFSGTLTRSNNRRGRAAAAAAPEDRLLIETDAPDLPPVIREASDGAAHVPAVNEPAYLVHVAAALAEIRGWNLEKTAEVTAANARRVLNALHAP